MFGFVSLSAYFVQVFKVYESCQTGSFGIAAHNISMIFFSKLQIISWFLSIQTLFLLFHLNKIKKNKKRIKLRSWQMQS